MTGFPWRVGQGVDVHRFTEGDHVVLCGVKIPHDRGVLAHSDGDVALHALCDALLGALALGDIGQHFPDTDERWRGADSRVLLRRVVSLVSERGFAVGNVDMTLLAERPRISPWLSAMQAAVAEDLGVERDAVSIKATTSEKLGYVGRQEGLMAMAVVLLARHL
ncbi:MAG: 2-C-methyl-D-erythritol 2,4-cyclodiphosphate synthase [Pseudomonadales bacterium]|nr:2-C-methyl-D-erythritol 2,4-cyclodiphosphate synthase [Pseudomonadales bacterium]